MATFRLVLPKAPWLSCLEELRLCYGWALRDAGHAVTFADTYLSAGAPGEDYTLAFGAHAVAPPNDPSRMIIANSEHHDRHFTEAYDDVLRASMLIMNMGPFAGPSGLHIDVPIVTCPPGILSLDRVVEHSPLWVPGGGRTIDVLFYGSVTSYRARMFEALSKAGVQVTALYGVLGEKRDWYIDRAKVVLDLKQEGEEPDDQTRAWWPLSRGACVLSENAPNPGTPLSVRLVQAPFEKERESLETTIVARVRKALDSRPEFRDALCKEYVRAIGKCDVSPLLKALGL